AKSPWRQAQDFSVGTIGEHVQRSLGTLVHAADARIQLRQQSLFADDTLVVQDQAYERAADERRDEEVAAPRREQSAGVERDAGRCDVGRPEIHRLLHAFLRRLVAVAWLPGALAAVA